MIAFEKWEGLGNDFIVVDERVFSAETDHATIARLCDRRTGIGGDGVLVVGERDGVPSMVVRNADGSRPEMCGNGLRCVLGWMLADERAALHGQVEVGDRDHPAEAHRDVAQLEQRHHGSAARGAARRAKRSESSRDPSRPCGRTSIVAMIKSE